VGVVVYVLCGEWGLVSGGMFRCGSGVWLGGMAMLVMLVVIAIMMNNWGQ
jgi:hypothetical protein